MVIISRSSPQGKLPIPTISKSITNYWSTVDTIMEPAPADSSPGVSSTPATSVISPSPTTTAKNASTSIGELTKESIGCDYCNTTFKYGKCGLFGQTCNLRRHIKHKHPETIPNYQREIYKCRYNCGKECLYISSIRRHEKHRCEVKKKALRSQKPKPVASKDMPIQEQEQEQEHSELEVGTDAHSREAQKAL